MKLLVAPIVLIKIIHWMDDLIRVINEKSMDKIFEFFCLKKMLKSEIKVKNVRSMIDVKCIIQWLPADTGLLIGTLGRR